MRNKWVFKSLLEHLKNAKTRNFDATNKNRKFMKLSEIETKILVCKCYRAFFSLRKTYIS